MRLAKLHLNKPQDMKLCLLERRTKLEMFGDASTVRHNGKRGDSLPCFVAAGFWHLKVAELPINVSCRAKCDVIEPTIEDWPYLGHATAKIIPHIP